MVVKVSVSVMKALDTLTVICLLYVGDADTLITLLAIVTYWTLTLCLENGRTAHDCPPCPDH